MTLPVVGGPPRAPGAVLPRLRDVFVEFGIYVHIPFCSHRCWYCDFNAYAGLDYLAEAYMDALVRDVVEARSAPGDADLAERPTVTSIFIGGGTPSLVDARHIARMLDGIRSSWPVDLGAEVTIECNPESVDERKLAAYLDAGVNRVSFGIQSLDDELLSRLGRMHDAATALAALDAAHRAGFDNVSADLIFGIPGEDDDRWRRSLEGVLARSPTHVSCYALTYEEGTPLHAWRRLGKVVPESDDLVADRWETADAMLTTAGLHRYEISNWGLPSRHNTLYWAPGEYLGVGAGAHSHVASSSGSTRSWTARAPERYIRAVADGATTVWGSERIDRELRASEVMVLGLRRTRGVDATTFAALTGLGLEETFGDELAVGVRRGLLDWDGRTVRVVRPLLGDDAARLFA